MYIVLYIKIKNEYHYIAINCYNHYLVTKLTNVGYKNTKINWLCNYCYYSKEDVGEFKCKYMVLLDKKYSNKEIDAITDENETTINQQNFNLLYFLYDYIKM